MGWSGTIDSKLTLNILKPFLISYSNLFSISVSRCAKEKHIIVIHGYI